MRFIVDESTGNAVVHHLRALGHDVLSVGETLPQADDEEILLLAEQEDRILITNDKDFGDLVFRHGYQHRGVLLLRLSDDIPQVRVSVVSEVLESYSSRLYRNFAVATEKGVRIRY